MLRCRYSDIVPGDMLIDVSHSTYKCGRKTWYLVLERSRPTSESDVGRLSCQVQPPHRRLVR